MPSTEIGFTMAVTVKSKDELVVPAPSSARHASRLANGCSSRSRVESSASSPTSRPPTTNTLQPTMEIVLSDRAIEALTDAPPNVQQAFEKQSRLLAANLQHPSLDAKKYDQSRDLWQDRINRPRGSISQSSFYPKACRLPSCGPSTL